LGRLSLRWKAAIEQVEPRRKKKRLKFAMLSVGAIRIATGLSAHMTALVSPIQGFPVRRRKRRPSRAGEHEDRRAFSEKTRYAGSSRRFKVSCEKIRNEE
tara:strand:- start:58 stop:357 length:300 start_codon:yes stop_codon:yes gene_type:complete